MFKRLSMFVMVWVVLLLIGCGGGSSNTGAGPTPVPEGGLQTTIFTATHGTTVVGTDTFDTVSVEVEFTNESIEPIFIAEGFLAIGSCGDSITDIHFGYTDYGPSGTYLEQGALVDHGYFTTTLSRSFDGMTGPCDLYSGVSYPVTFYIEGAGGVILAEETAYFTVP